MAELVRAGRGFGDVTVAGRPQRGPDQTRGWPKTSSKSVSAVGLFRAVAIGSGETAVFVVVDDRMVTFGTVVHPRDATGRP